VLNSLGLSQLLDLMLRICEDHQGALLLSGMNPLMQEVATLSGVTMYAQCVESIDAALLKLSGA